MSNDIAHDFNDLLLAIRGHSELLLAETEPGTRARLQAEQIVAAAGDAIALTRDLSNRPCGSAVLDAAHVLAVLERLDESLVARVEADLPSVLLAEGELERLVGALLRGASGPVDVEVAADLLDDRPCVRFSVSPIAVLDSDFCELAQRHGIRVERTQSVVSLYAASVTSPEQDAACGETILVVEDDHGVRSLVYEVLESSGYRVLQAADGVTAFAVAEAYGDTIDLLVTDMVMPRLDGRALIDLLAAANPHLRVLCMSGGRREDIEGATFLRKPFTLAELTTSVRVLLDR
jgi:CheY-like chemotaxis protein